MRVRSKIATVFRSKLSHIVVAVIGIALLVFTIRRVVLERSGDGHHQHRLVVHRGRDPGATRMACRARAWIVCAAPIRRASGFGMPSARYRRRRHGQPDTTRPVGQRTDQDPHDARRGLDGHERRVGDDRERVLHRIGASSCCSMGPGFSSNVPRCLPALEQLIAGVVITHRLRRDCRLVGGAFATGGPVEARAVHHAGWPADGPFRWMRSVRSNHGSTAC